MIRLYIFLRCAFVYSYSLGEFHKVAVFECHKGYIFDNGGIFTLGYDNVLGIIDDLERISNLELM